LPLSYKSDWKWNYVNFVILTGPNGVFDLKKNFALIELVSMS